MENATKNSFGYSFTKKQEPQLKKYDFKQQAFLGVEATQGREVTNITSFRSQSNNMGGN